ncbi:hypothetical protein [Paenibacillus turpanensis]|uniref:hypothetical protein n=1 Tax=Paenibacillus turpanensis TaxID=2689078 RepID=UPI003133489D
MYQLKDRELIFVFTGPDGSGRKSLADAVGMTLEMRKVLSYTTRERRAFEVEGQDYHFVTREQFYKWLGAGEFLEAVEIDGNWYGILKQGRRGNVPKNRLYLFDYQPRGCGNFENALRG